MCSLKSEVEVTGSTSLQMGIKIVCEVLAVVMRGRGRVARLLDEVGGGGGWVRT